MTKPEALQLIFQTKTWLRERSKEGAKESFEIIFDSFEIDEIGGKAVAAPVPFEKFTSKPDWPQSKESKSVASQINRIREKMDGDLFPLRSSVYLIHEDGRCFLFLGESDASTIRLWKEDGRPKGVTLSFDKAASEKEGLLNFTAGDNVEISASSHLKGWIYLYCIDANQIITPIYPAEGKRSELKISQNLKKNLSDEVNDLIQKESPHHTVPPLKFGGNAAGIERIVAMVTEKPVPVTIAHLKSRIPLPLLYSHELKTKGVGESRTNSTNDFDSLTLDQIAIGTLDYYYNA